MKPTLLILGAALIAASLLPRIMRRRTKRPVLDHQDLAFWLNLSDEEAAKAADKFHKGTVAPCNKEEA